MKRIKELKVGLVILAFLITIGVLFGGQALTTKVKVDTPLKRDLYSLKDIQSFSVKQEKDGIIISLKLRKVDNLQKVLDFVQQKIALYYGLPVKEFKIADQRNRSLEQARYKLAFYLQEAAVSGHYIRLKEALDSFKEVNAKAYVSQNYIYVQLEEGRNYLYEVVPVPTRTIAVNNNLGGDSA